MLFHRRHRDRGDDLTVASRGHDSTSRVHNLPSQVLQDRFVELIETAALDDHIVGRVSQRDPARRVELRLLAKSSRSTASGEDAVQRLPLSVHAHACGVVCHVAETKCDW